MNFYGARRSKFGAIKTVYNGQCFDSKKEAMYAQELDLLQKGKAVKEYRTQVDFKLYVMEKYIGKYVLDFQVLYSDGRTEYVDVKGVRTALYKWKKKHVEAQYGIKITEV